MLPKIFGIVTLRGSWPEPCPGSPLPDAITTAQTRRNPVGSARDRRWRHDRKGPDPCQADVPDPVARGTGVKLTRRPKDRDFVETREGFFFCLVGYVHPPEAVQWISTSVCDLSCPHCYSNAGKIAPSSVSANGR